MLKLKRLRLSGIGRFVEEQDIPVENLGSLVQVDGENQNTDGSSGSGKSTLFNALDYLLGLNDLPSTVLQSRLTKEALTVIGNFDWDGKELIVTRGKKLKIEIDGVPTEGSAAITEAKLVEILGMPPKLFRKMLHKRQKEGGFFLDFTPKEMYEFLMDALKLKKLRADMLVVDTRLASLESAKTTLENGLQSNLSALQSTQDGILALGLAPVKDIHQPVILELKSKLDSATVKFNETQERHKNEIQELEKERPQTSTPVFDRSAENGLQERRKALETEARTIILAERNRQSAANSAINERNQLRMQLNYAIREADAAKLSATETASQVKKIRDAVCFTCDQHWVTDKAKDTEAQLLAKLTELKEKISQGASAAERIKVVDAEIADLKLQLVPIVDPLFTENQKEQNEVLVALAEEKKKADEFYVYHNHVNQAILKEFAAKQQDLRGKQALEMDQVRGQKDVDGRAFEAAVAKLKAYEDARQRYDTALTTMKKREAEQIKNIEFNRTVLAEHIAEIDKATELKRGLKNFASVSFDEALDAIGDTATRIIRGIPNMANATIQFEGQKETQDGKVKEEVNAVISSDGEVGVPIKSLSGGERSSVDFAVDLAVIDYLESKTGTGIDLFILDEPFTGLDTVSIENALEVLKNANINKRLIIVDHNPEVKQMVSSRLVVVREGQTSRVVMP